MNRATLQMIRMNPTSALLDFGIADHFHPGLAWYAPFGTCECGAALHSDDRDGQCATCATYGDAPTSEDLNDHADSMLLDEVVDPLSTEDDFE